MKEFVRGNILFISGVSAFLGLCIVLIIMTDEAYKRRLLLMTDGFLEKYGVLFLGALFVLGINVIPDNIDDTVNTFTSKETYKYQAVVDGKIRHFYKCYKIHGHNVCENGEGDGTLVKDYWKKGDTNGKN